jgi:hypothetical protein
MKHEEQHTADLLRLLYKLGLIGGDMLSDMIDELQIRLIEREACRTQSSSLLALVQRISLHKRPYGTQ